MSHFPSLKEGDYLEALFKRFPAGVRPLLEMHDAIMRAPSDLSVGERELISAYVSGLNACQFCFGAHKAMAQAFGYEQDFVDTLVNDGPEAAGVEAKMIPLLDYVHQLTKEPSKTRTSQAEAVYAAGWSEDVLYIAVQVCALYSYMNRILDGAGLEPKALFADPGTDELEARRNSTYMGWGQKAGLID